VVQIRWTEDAEEDLIYTYISKNSSKYAELQVIRIIERTKILHQFPHLGNIVRESDSPEVRELVEGSYRIIYRIKTEQIIDILFIHHSARDLSKRNLD
jgi:plasmid stabilization system protein ParE